MPVTTRRHAKEQALKKMEDQLHQQLRCPTYLPISDQDQDSDFVDSDYAPSESDQDTIVPSEPFDVTGDAFNLIPTRESYEKAVDETIDRCAACLLENIAHSMRNSCYEGVLDPNKVLRPIYANASDNPLVVWQSWHRATDALRSQGHKGKFWVDRSGRLCWHIYTKYESRFFKRFLSWVVNLLMLAFIVYGVVTLWTWYASD